MQPIKLSLAALSILLVAGIMHANEARAGCYPFKCCDQWGYDYPGFYTTNNGCENAGGEVECDVYTCSNATFPFKCCDSTGAPIPGIYGSPHACKMAGHEVFDGLICPNTQPFRCCRPDEGGDAPGVYLYQSSCIADGYVVEPFNIGCPGGVVDQWKEDFHNAWIRPFCFMDMKEHYDEVVQAGTGQTLFDEWQTTYNDANGEGTWNDRDKHCILSCLITVECGERSAEVAGWGNEMQQMCDGDEGNAWGSGDECANKYGRDYGVTLSTTSAAAAEGDCRTYCNNLDLIVSQPAVADPDMLCGPNTLVLETLTDGLADIEAAIPDTIYVNFLSWEWSFTNPLQTLINSCDDGLLFPLTLPSSVTSLAETFAELKDLGLQLTTAASVDLAVGERGLLPGGSLMYRSDTDAYSLSTNIARGLDTLIGYKDGAIEEIYLRDSGGETIVMRASDPAPISCSNPPCEERLAWLQWVRLRERVPSIYEASP